MFHSAFSQRRREGKRNPVGPVLRTFLSSLQAGFVTWIADCMDRYVFNVYAPHHNVFNEPPSIRGCKVAAGRDYVKMDPASVWRVVENSRRTGMQIKEVLKARKSDADCGGCDDTALSIESYEVGLYGKRAKLSFQGSPHVVAGFHGVMYTPQK